ncbi:hypothetical protein LSAT2_029612 [Lamellibrachia satsuma]|nr:hypothetical protein LSAT2_029612 [Lamellibrachia satsuma]
MRGADCSTDHHLIRCILKIDVHITRRRQAAKPKRRLNVAKLPTTTGRADLRLRVELIYATLSENSINDDWESFRYTYTYTLLPQNLSATGDV